TILFDISLLTSFPHKKLVDLILSTWHQKSWTYHMQFAVTADYHFPVQKLLCLIVRMSIQTKSYTGTLSAFTRLPVALPGSVWAPVELWCRTGAVPVVHSATPVVVGPSPPVVPGRLRVIPVEHRFIPVWPRFIPVDARSRTGAPPAS
ncbi:hypothetical protein DPMN_006973, partial [Dreissena polymorpha]